MSDLLTKLEVSEIQEDIWLALGGRTAECMQGEAENKEPQCLPIV